MLENLVLVFMCLHICITCGYTINAYEHDMTVVLKVVKRMQLWRKQYAPFLVGLEEVARMFVSVMHSNCLTVI